MDETDTALTALFGEATPTEADHYLKRELFGRVRAGGVFEALEAGAADGVWYWDLEQPEHEWMSPRFWQLFGYDPASKPHLSSAWRDLIHPDDLRGAMDNFEKHRADPNHPYDQYVRYRHRDGSTVWVRCRGRALRDANGKAIRMLGTHVDVTALKVAEQALRSLTERFSLATRSAGIGVWDWDVVHDRITWDERMYALYGLTGEQFGGAYEAWRRGLHAEDAARGDAEIRQALRDEREFDTEFRVVWPSGEVRQLRAHALVERDPAGAPTRMVGVNYDITERKRAEHTRAQLANIVESTSDAIVGRTIDGVVTSWNRGAEHIFGYRADEIIGQPIGVLFPPHLPDAETSFAARLVGGERIEHFETERAHKDGRLLDVSVTLSLLQDASGNILGISMIARDISEFKQIQRELVRAKEMAEAASRELESFSYSVAHDLRAPLRIIDGFSQALVEDCGAVLDENGLGLVQQIRGSAQLMAQLIDDMLGLSRVTRQELDRRRVDLSTLARASAGRLARGDSGREVELVIEEGLAAEGDARLLAVLFDNLLGNAWKFTSKRALARIAFGATEREGLRTYFVRDNGAGFDMNYAGKLFGVFQRLHTVGEFEGTGVGLATVQRIVQRHQGRVWAEGAVNVGATVYFTLG